MTDQEATIHLLKNQVNFLQSQKLELEEKIEKLKGQARRDQRIKTMLIRFNLQTFTELQRERTNRTERANE